MRLASQGLDLGWAGLSDDVGAVKAALASPSLAPTAKTVRGMCDFHLFVLYACGCMHNYCPNCMRLNSKIRKVCCATKLVSLGEGIQFNPRLQQRRQQPKPLANVKWAHGVVVSHPLSMQEALGSIPSVSILEEMRVFSIAAQASRLQHKAGIAACSTSNRKCAEGERRPRASQQPCILGQLANHHAPIRSESVA